MRCSTRVSDLLIDTVNSGVEESYVTEKQIELEIRALVSTIMRFTKQTNQWLTTTRAINTALKVRSMFFLGTLLISCIVMPFFPPILYLPFHLICSTYVPIL